MKRYCKQCDSYLTLDNFAKRSKFTNTLCAYCKSCSNTNTRKWNEKKRQEQQAQIKSYAFDMLSQCVRGWYA
jgi:hypothetical protein